MRWIRKTDEVFMKQRIHVIYVGGTIGMAPTDAADPNSPLAPQPLEALLNDVPNLAVELPQVQLDFESLAEPLDSANITPQYWADIARRIAMAYAQHDGFVVLHGTDTLAYTASALAFLLEHLGKPVVVTGAQHPLASPQSDAPKNLLDAITVAASQPAWPEVLVVFGGQILRGCRSRKRSSVEDVAFDSPNIPALGQVQNGQVDWAVECTQRIPQPCNVLAFQAAHIIDVTLTPTLTAAQFAHLVAADCDAVLLRLYGAGTAPQPADWQAVLQALQQRGVPIFAVTQCWQGHVDLAAYAAGSDLQRYGVVGLADMTPEAAIAKLSVVLGQPDLANGIAAMCTSWCGEITTSCE